MGLLPSVFIYIDVDSVGGGKANGTRDPGS